MHTWLRRMATSINRHDNSLLLRGKCTLNAEKNMRWVSNYMFPELFILNFFYFPWKICKNAVCHEQTQQVVQKQLCAQCHNCHFAHSLEDFGVDAVALAN